MRPRVFPAEDFRARNSTTSRGMAASMRPRVFPAEDPGGQHEENNRTSGFNEAAGIPRGRLELMLEEIMLYGRLQ